MDIRESFLKEVACKTVHVGGLTPFQLVHVGKGNLPVMGKPDGEDHPSLGLWVGGNCCSLVLGGLSIQQVCGVVLGESAFCRL